MAQRLKAVIKKYISLFQQFVEPFFSKSPFLSALYYLLCNRSFQYEQQSLLKGKLYYKKHQGVHEGSSALLRRNIHRLEKGLIMRPRRAVFALDYIAQTVEIFERVGKQKNINEKEYLWATAVLQKYFQVVDTTHPLLSKLVSRFQLLKPHSKQLTQLPYPHTQKQQHAITYDAFFELAKARRSTRWYQGKPVEHEKIEQAVALALQAPSACNRQPFEYVVISQPPLLKKVAAIPGGTAGFSDNIPCLIAVVGDLSYYPMERDRHVIYIDGSLSAMQFMLALETLGLSSCPINWPELHKQDKKISSLLKLPQFKRVVMFIAVGYALNEGYIPYSAKKQQKDVIRYL